MERRDNALGYLAVALGLAAFVLAFVGQSGGPPMRVSVPAAVHERVELVAPQVVPAPQAAPAQPAAPPAVEPPRGSPAPPVEQGPMKMPLPPMTPAAPMFQDHVYIHGIPGPFALFGGLGRFLVAVLLIACGIRLVRSRNGASPLPQTGETTRL